MKNGKYQNKKSGFNVRPLVLMLAVALLIGATIGGTIAWLTASTQKVENTFTVGNIDITLTETGTQTGEDGKTQEKEFKMVPGNVLVKDPKVTVLATSEASWVFVKVEESNNLSTYIDYDVITGVEDAEKLTEGTYWNVLGDTYPGVYYCKVKATGENQTIELPVIGYTDTKGTTDTSDDVFVNNKVLVKTTVTKEMMDALEQQDETLPKLTFTAYAIQQASFDTAAAAWAEVSK